MVRRRSASTLRPAIYGHAHRLCRKSEIVKVLSDQFSSSEIVCPYYCGLNQSAASWSVSPKVVVPLNTSKYLAELQFRATSNLGTQRIESRRETKNKASGYIHRQTLFRYSQRFDSLTLNALMSQYCVWGTAAFRDRADAHPFVTRARQAPKTLP